MKLAIITLSTIAAASSLIQPATAQGARFDFKVEFPKIVDPKRIRVAW